MHYVVTTSPGLEGLALVEAEQILKKKILVRPEGSLEFEGDLKELTLYMCASHLASRVLMPLATFHAWEKEILYQEVKEMPWETLIGESETFIMDVHGKTDDCDYSAAQGLLKIKDALVDRIREQRGNRPDVNKEDPTHRVEIYFWKGKVEISIDLCGEPLHRRGYRVGIPGPSPLRESRAAMLVKMGLDDSTPEAVYDCFCGTGTIAIEAAMILRKIPPANLRYIPQKKFLPEFHATYLETLTDLRAKSLAKCPVPIHASDIESEIIPRAKRFAAKAGVSEDIEFTACDFEEAIFEKGVLVSNPPYGERIQTLEEARSILDKLGRKIKFGSEISKMVLLVPHGLETAVGMKPQTKIKMKAGPLDLTATRFEIWRK